MEYMKRKKPNIIEKSKIENISSKSNTKKALAKSMFNSVTIQR